VNPADWPGFTADRNRDDPVDTAVHWPILNHMVNFQSAPLDRTFAALADPTRRALVMRLAAEPDISVSALAAPFPVSLPAIMKHLDVLSEAGLVARTKTGRVVACRLDAEPMRDAFEWLNRYQKFWSERLDRLAAFLEEKTSWPPKPPQSRASPSNATSTRRRPRSSRRGPTRKK
jgi:DNA-binding transcriptional ArsR family regulator